MSGSRIPGGATPHVPRRMASRGGGLEISSPLYRGKVRQSPSRFGAPQAMGSNFHFTVVAHYFSAWLKHVTCGTNNVDYYSCDTSKCVAWAGSAESAEFRSVTKHPSFFTFFLHFPHTSPYYKTPAMSRYTLSDGLRGFPSVFMY